MIYFAQKQPLISTSMSWIFWSCFPTLFSLLKLNFEQHFKSCCQNSSVIFIILASTVLFGVIIQKSQSLFACFCREGNGLLPSVLYNFTWVKAISMLLSSWIKHSLVQLHLHTDIEEKAKGCYPILHWLLSMTEQIQVPSENKLKVLELVGRCWTPSLQIRSFNQALASSIITSVREGWCLHQWCLAVFREHK